MRARALSEFGAAGAALAALAAALLGCSATSSTITHIANENPVPGVRKGDWATVRNLATRRDRLYDRFSERAIVTATYLGAPQREAEVNRLAEWLGWTPEEKARRLKAELDEAARYDDFLLAFYTGERKSNDLDARSSVWRVALKLEGGDVVSHDATNIDVNVTILGLFPYVSPFDTVYRVRFDKVAGAPLAGRKFGMEIASALGKLELTFGDGTIGPDRIPGTPLPD